MNLFGLNIGGQIKDAAEGVKTAAEGIGNAIRGTNPELDAKVLELTSKSDELQTAINKAQAGSFFHSGWRSCLGWICVLALFNNYVLATYFSFIRQFDLTQLIFLLTGMLGLATNRTIEKVKGVQANH